MKAEAPVHPVSQGSRVRRASPQDSEKLVRLCQQLGYPSSIQQIETQRYTMHGREDHAIMVVELAGGRVAGWVHIFERPLVFQPGGAEIGGLIVDEAERGQGFGSMLIARDDTIVNGKITSWRVLVGSCELSAERIILLYEKRWAIEEYHKQIKALGLNFLPNGKFLGLLLHVLLVVLSYLLLHSVEKVLHCIGKSVVSIIRRLCVAGILAGPS